MDSAMASHLMAKMIGLLDHAFTDGQQKTWETFKLLLGEGYSPEEIFELHRLKRDLQVAMEGSESGRTLLPAVETILQKMEHRIR
jgi:hypothetical protein